MLKYWKPEPKQRSFAWWALLLPAVVWFVGVIFYAHNALVPGMAQENGHAIGSALMVIGGESGTLAAASEVFRKHAEGETVLLDWLGMIVSLVATLGNMLVVYVALATHLQAPWIDPVRQWGPLVLLLCSGLDFYAGVMEFGFYNAGFNARWIAWNDGEHAWRQAQETRRAKLEAPPVAVVNDDVNGELDELAMQVYTLYTDNPGITKTQLAQLAQVSRPTVDKRLKQLVKAGKLQGI